MSAAGTAYKIADRAEWDAAVAAGRYDGSAVDRADGFIHLSDAGQLAETARRHYAGRAGLVLACVDLTRLDATLRWEASRGGALFPHIHGPLPMTAVTATRDLRVTAEGVMIFADGGVAP